MGGGWKYLMTELTLEPDSTGGANKKKFVDQITEIKKMNSRYYYFYKFIF
jgi:hypothetical protein